MKRKSNKRIRIQSRYERALEALNASLIDSFFASLNSDDDKSKQPCADEPAQPVPQPKNN